MKMKYLKDEFGRTDKRYMISEDGSYIRDKKTGKKLIPYISAGYKVITIVINVNKYSGIKICHLQWMAWKKKIPKSHVIHHKVWSKNKKINEKLKLNDNIDNLDCMTKGDHMSLHMTGENHHMFGRRGKLAPFYGKHHTEEVCKKMKMAKLGEKNPVVKLTQKEVNEIRHKYYWIKDSSTCKLAKIYGVTHQTISKIIHGQRWNPNNLTEYELQIKSKLLRIPV